MTYVILVIAALLCEVSCNLPIGSMPLALTAEGASRSSTAVAMGCGMFAALAVSVPRHHGGSLWPIDCDANRCR